MQNHFYFYSLASKNQKITLEYISGKPVFHCKTAVYQVKASKGFETATMN